MYKLSSSYSNDKEWRELDYWDSGKAIKLFNLTLGKLVKQCICDRDKLLQNIIEDADKVETIIEDWNNDCTTQLTARQERCIVTQCLYIRKAYKIAVQCMNPWTWKECCTRQSSPFVTVENTMWVMKKQYDAGIFTFESTRHSQIH